jgi:hypothetical protein
MNAFMRALLVGAVLAIGGAAVAAATADPIVGTWNINLAKSTFHPGPAPKAHTRTYTETAQGISLTFNGIAADGSPISGHSTFKYDGKDYPIAGTPDYDTLVLKRIDSNTVKSKQKKAGKVIGSTTRTISKDGKVMTLASKGTRTDGVTFDDVMVFDKK